MPTRSSGDANVPVLPRPPKVARADLPEVVEEAEGALPSQAVEAAAAEEVEAFRDCFDAVRLGEWKAACSGRVCHGGSGLDASRMM